MSTILDNIVEQTAEDLSRTKQRVSFKDLESFESYEKDRRDFKKALRQQNEVSIIAEVKKASPSKGVIRADFHPDDIALRYEEGGAAAISVLTDQPFFQGSLQYLESISKCVEIPVLRKDFVIDPYQVKEARAYGADAILIIVAITEGRQLEELLHATEEFGLEALVECYDQKDLDRLDLETVSVLGVNNRDLNTFEVDLHRGIKILKQAPKDTILVSESGLSTPEDMNLLRIEGIHSALIGEHFMRQEEPGKALKELREKAQQLFLKESNNE